MIPNNNFQYLNIENFGSEKKKKKKIGKGVFLEVFELDCSF